MPRKSKEEASTSVNDDDLILQFASKLDQAGLALIKSSKIKCADLDGFDLKRDVVGLEEILKIRHELESRVRNFDEEGKTAVNLSDAAFAGAKLACEEAVMTRGKLKRVASALGVSDDAFLYNCESLWDCKSWNKHALNLAKRRKEDIIESFVDLQNQLKFKRSVLQHVEEKYAELNAPKLTRRSAAARLNNTPNHPKRKNSTRTPRRRGQVNPLSHTRIMDDYADCLASMVADRRKSVPMVKRGSLKPQRLFDDLDDKENEVGASK